MGPANRRAIDFTIRFEKCQYVKSVDDEVAEGEDEDSVVFVIKHLVVCSCCSSNFRNDCLPI